MSKKIKEIETLKNLVIKVLNTEILMEQAYGCLSNNESYRQELNDALVFLEKLETPNRDINNCDHDFVQGPYSKDDNHQYCLKCGVLK